MHPKQELEDATKFNQGASQDWIEQDQLYEICQHLGVQDWQEIYSLVDVENLFENYVIEMNHGQVIDIGGEQRMQITPVSSGVHIGSSNWTLAVSGEHKM